ncbi:14466_t:CDS:2, partial [Ambispora leptoticha]
RTQRNRVKELRATISNLCEELSGFKQKLEIEENVNKNLLEIVEKNEKLYKDYKKRTEEALDTKNCIIFSNGLITPEFVINYRNEADFSSDLFSANDLDDNGSNIDNSIHSNYEHNTDVDVITPRAKKLKATISILNKELSDLKQKLEIKENDNKKLLKINENLEKRFDDYKKSTEESLTYKNLIISALFKNNRNGFGFVPDLSFTPDLYFANDLSMGDNNNTNNINNNSDYTQSQLDNNADINLNSIINSIINNNDVDIIV